jgi:hypothetical protein
LTDCQAMQNLESQSPARKKRKMCLADTSPSDSQEAHHILLNHDCPDGILQKILVEEFGVEISLRQRLADTIESRIAWALLLKNSLSSHDVGEFTLLCLV